MTFFTLGNHHDFAIVAVGPDGPDAADNGPGLFHVAFKAGDSLASIAVRELNGTATSDDIFKLNRKTLASKHDLKPGLERSD